MPTHNKILDITLLQTTAIIMHYIYYKADGDIVGMQMTHDSLDMAKSQFISQLRFVKTFCGVADEDAIDVYVYRPTTALTAQLILTDENNNIIQASDKFEAYVSSYKIVTKPFRETYKSHTKKGFISGIKDWLAINVDWGEMIFLAIVGFIVLAPIMALVFWLQDCQREYVKEQRSAWVTSYNNFNPATPPAEVSAPTTNNYNDARIALMQELKDKYSHERYQHSPARVTARIDGDTLLLFAGHYKDDVNRMLVRDDDALKAQFKACQFAVVKISTADAGGCPYWVIYTDASVNHPTTKKNNEKTKVKRHTTSGDIDLDDIVDERVQEYLHEHGIEEADLEY